MELTIILIFLTACGLVINGAGENDTTKIFGSIIFIAAGTALIIKAITLI